MKWIIPFVALFSLSAFAQEDIYTVDCNDFNKACTAEYAPVKCSYGTGKALRGSNTCVAIDQVEVSLCAVANTDTIVLDRRLMKCEKSQ